MKNEMLNIDCWMLNDESEIWKWNLKDWIMRKRNGTERNRTYSTGLDWTTLHYTTLYYTALHCTYFIELKSYT